MPLSHTGLFNQIIRVSVSVIGRGIFYSGTRNNIILRVFKHVEARIPCYKAADLTLKSAGVNLLNSINKT